MSRERIEVKMEKSRGMDKYGIHKRPYICKTGDFWICEHGDRIDSHVAGRPMVTPPVCSICNKYMHLKKD